MTWSLCIWKRKNHVSWKLQFLVASKKKHEISWNTNRDIVTNSRPQLEKPISMPAAMPVGANFLKDFRQSM